MNTRLVSSAQQLFPCRILAAFPLWGIAVLAVALGPGCGAAGPVNPCDPSLARTLVVEHGDEVATVLLGDLPGEPDGERCLVSLEDAVLGANLGLDLADTYMDLRADDGFQPSQVECALLPGSTLSQGMVDRRTGFVSWPDELDMRGCYFIRGLAVILVLDASELP